MNIFNMNYFDNEMGKLDEFNPRFVFSKPNTKEILFLIGSNQPFYFSIKNLQKQINVSDMEFANSLKLLTNISAIKIKNDKIALNFPFFLDKDCKVIKKIILRHIKDSAKFFENELKSFEDVLKNLFPEIDAKISLYHLLCGKIFDGVMFDYLEKKNLLKQSYPKKHDRDFMLIGYQNSSYCNNFNKELFCSFNHARYKKSSLSSFGNAFGNRLDFFRYYKLREVNKTYGKFNEIDKILNSYSNEEITKNCLSLIERIKQNKKVNNNVFFEALKFFKYVDDKGQIIVPVFSEYVNKFQKFSKLVFKTLGAKIEKELSEITREVINSNISCVKHNVPIDEISNELWHVYFGLLNGRFVQNGFVAEVSHFKGEGKYLKCIYLENEI